MRWWLILVDFQVVLVLSQVVNANPSDSQVYVSLYVTSWLKFIITGTLYTLLLYENIMRYNVAVVPHQPFFVSEN